VSSNTIMNKNNNTFPDMWT